MVLYILLMLALIYLDQLTKWLAVIYLRGQDSLPVWKDVLHLTYLENKGAAFGMMQNYRWVFIGVSAVAIVGMLIFLFKKHRTLPALAKLSLAIIISGGIGNMIDRIFLGYVVDFVDVTIINFAVFNVADSCITVGAVLLCAYVLFFTEDSKKGKKTEETGSIATGGVTPGGGNTPDSEENFNKGDLK